jgi:protein O-mannosyl-transferase
MTDSIDQTRQNRFPIATILWMLAIAAVVLAIYLPTLAYPFQYDDGSKILANGAVTTPRPLADYFLYPARGMRNETLAKQIYRPGQTIVHMLLHQWADWDVRVFRAVNLAAFLALALLAFRLLLVVFDNRFLAGAATLLFVVHPVHAEGVIWISSLSGLGSTAFGMAALVLLVRRDPRDRPEPARIVAALLCYAAALSFKEAAVTFPVLLVAVHLVQTRRATAPLGEVVRAAWPVYLPVAALTIGYLALRFVAVGAMTQDLLWGDGYATHLRTGLSALLTYARLAVWPVSLKLEYPVPFVASWLDPRFFGVLFLLATGAALAWCGRRADRAPLALGVAFFLVPLLPVLNLLPIAAVVAERFLRLSLLGAALLAAYALSLAFASDRRLRLTAIAVLVVASLALVAVGRPARAAWASMESLWAREVAFNPGEPKGYYNLGSHYLTTGRYVEAEAVLRQGLRNWPTHSKMLNHYAAAVMEIGDHHAAERVLARALASDPQNHQARFNLALALLAQGKCAAAYEALAVLPPTYGNPAKIAFRFCQLETASCGAPSPARAAGPHADACALGAQAAATIQCQTKAPCPSTDALND